MNTQQPPAFIELWERFQREQRAKAALEKAATETLSKMWENWDGIAVFEIDGVYIPDSWLVTELQKRGVDTNL